MKANLRLVRQNLEARLQEATSHSGLADSIRVQQAADPIDMTQDAAERDLAVQILDRGSAVARQLRAALERIDGGSYGLCVHCEQEIAAARLRAIPWAESCIRCQEQLEESSLAQSRRAA